LKSYRGYETSFYDSVSARAGLTAQEISELVGALFEPSNMIDIGCGDGVWSKTFLNDFPKIAVTAVDLPEAQFKFLSRDSKNISIVRRNFEQEVNLPDEVYDLAICVEVLEHLELQTAEKIMDYIATHSRFAIVSGATRGQGGTHHINENDQDYWVDSMRKRGMVAFDVVRPKLQKKDGIPSYYKNNIFLYIGTDLTQDHSANQILQKLESLPSFDFQDTRNIFLRVIHYLLRNVSPSYITSIARMKSKFKNSIMK
jgi:ubiquinone/menaquinone biosynthesis C-methylase UbiE